MRALWFTIGSAATIAVLACLPTGDASRRGRPWHLLTDEHGNVRVDDFAPCDGARDATPGVRRALERARGRMLTVPAGCRLLLRSPGAGQAALTIGSDTTIRFASRTSAFVLARRRCVGGRFEGAACRTDEGCRGGACRCEGGDGPGCPFAPVPEQAYLVLAAEPASRAIVLDDVRIDVGGLDRFGRCARGADAGMPCATDADCGNGGTCAGAGDPPSGPGRINVLDLSMVGGDGNLQAPGAELRGVAIYDHARGDFSVKTGPGARVTGLSNALETDGARRMFRVPEIGLVAGSHNQVSTATVNGFRIGVQLASFSSLSNSAVMTLADGADNVAGTAVDVTGIQNLVESNHLTGFHCLSTSANNLTFASNRCLYGAGAKVVASGAGISVLGNYLAWGSGGGLCAAGPRTGLPCNAAYDCGADADCTGDGRCRGGSRDGARCGCPLARCRPDPVIRLTTPGSLTSTLGVDHLMIANNIVQSQVGAAFIGIPDVGFRCLNGPLRGASCSVANECGSFVGCDAGKCAGGERAGLPCDCPGAICGTVTIYNSMVVGNNFYTTLPMIGIDLSDLTSGGTRVAGLSVLSNRFSAPGTCVALPSDEATVSGLSVIGNDFAACKLDPRLSGAAAHASRHPTH